MDKKNIFRQLMVWGAVLVVAVSFFIYNLWNQRTWGVSSARITNQEQFNGEVYGEGIEKININLSSSNLNIYTTQEDFISIKQNANRKIKENEKLKIIVRDNQLEVSKPLYRRLVFGKLIGLRESIDIYIPESYTNDIRIGITSGSTSINGIKANSLEIDKTSGSIDISNIEVKSLKLESSSGSSSIKDSIISILRGSGTSGSLYLEDIITDKIELENTSGNVNIEGICNELILDTTSGSSTIKLENMPQQIKVTQTSGNSKIAIPENKGFMLEYEKTSASLNTDFELNGLTQIKSNGTYLYKDGSNTINIKSTSGSTILSKR